MSGEFDSMKDSQSTKFEQRPQIFVKLSFRELCDSKLSGLHALCFMFYALCFMVYMLYLYMLYDTFLI